MKIKWLAVAALISLNIISADTFASDGAGAALSQAFQMDGVAGFVGGRAQEAIKTAITQHGADWLCGAFAKASNALRRGGALNSLQQDPELKAAVQAELKNKIKEWLPGAVKDLVVGDIFGGAIGKEHLAEVDAISGRVMKEIDTSLNDKIDEVAGGMYDRAVGELQRLSAVGSVPAWVDATDIKKTISRAFDTGTIAGAVAGQLGQVVGDATVSGIRGRISDALSGQLPPEAIAALEKGPAEFDKYISKAEGFLPGNKLKDLTDSILNKPLIRLPTPAYAAILGATAAGHFAKAYKGTVVDPYELKRGIEVTNVMVWQLENKQYIALTLMQLGSLEGGLAASLGLGASFDGIMSKIRAPLERIKKLADNIDKLVMKPAKEISAELRGATDEMKAELAKLQDEIMGPVKENLAKIKEGLGEAADTISGAIPDELNGIPESLEELKQRASVDGGLLGKAGDWKPGDALEEIAKRAGLGGAAKKVKKDLSDLNDAVADKLSKGASGVLDALHITGPAAKIMDTEKIPAKDVSESKELDPVLLHNGEFTQEVTDLVIPGRGIDFRFTRIYRSRSKFLGEFGFNWTHSYAERLLPWNDGTADGFTHIDAQGRKFFFRSEGDGFILPPGMDARLVRAESGGYELQSRDGSVAVFDDQGRLAERRDRNGNSVKLLYNDTGLVSSIVDSYGRGVKIERRKDGLVSRMTDFAGRTFSYEYNDARELIGVTAPATPDFPKGKTTAYRYARVALEAPDAHALTMIMDPNGRVYLRNRYDEEGRVVGQSYGEGPWMGVVYAAGSGNVASRAWVTDARGIMRLYEHDADGHLLRLWRYGGAEYRLLSSHAYNDRGEKVATCTPSGRCTHFAYGEGPSRGDVVRVEEHPSGGGAARVMRIEREARYGLPSSVIDPAGGESRFEYDERGNIASVARCAKEGEGCAVHSRFQYNGCGQIASKTDGRGVATHYEYFQSSDPDGDGVPVKGAPAAGSACGYPKRIVVDAEGGPDRHAVGAPLARATSFSYDPIGNITSVTGPDGAASRYRVNALNQIAREEIPGFAPREYGFDANDNMVKVKILMDKRTVVHEFAYDVLDRPASEKWQVSKGRSIETRYVYDAAGLLVKVAHPEGGEEAYEYDDDGRVLCVVRGANSLEQARECVERNVDGDVVARIDGEGARTTLELNGFGEVAAEIDPLGNRVEYERDTAGKIVGERRMDPAKKILAESRFEYDASGNVIKYGGKLWRDDPGNAVWVDELSKYDPAGNLAAVIDRSGEQTMIDRDGLGEIVSVRRPSGRLRNFVRDAAGRVAESYIRSGDSRLDEKRFSYDAAGRVAGVNAGRDENWVYRYDGMGNLASIVDPYGVEAAYELDDLGRPLALVRDSKGLRATTRYEWDGDGRLVSLTDPNGGATRFSYNAQGSLVAERYADGTERRTAYDRAGRVVAVVDRNGTVLDIEHDAAGRLLSRRASSLTGVIGTHGQSFEYDGLGRIVAAVDFNDADDPGDDVVSRFVYDSLSRPVAEAQNDRWILREFNGAGLAVATALPSGRRLYLARNPEGKVGAVMDGGRGIASFEYDGAGNLAGGRFGGGIRFIAERDARGYPTELKYESPAGKWLAGSKIEYDGKGRVAGESTYAGITRRYSRDSLARLTEVKESDSYYYEGEGAPRRRSWRYDYDAAGNLKTAQEGRYLLEFTANQLNEYTGLVHRFMSKDGSHVTRDEKDPADSFAYDAAGNLATDSTRQLGPREYRYDAFGRLSAIWRGAAFRATKTGYKYDAFDRLIAKEVQGERDDFIWDGWRLAEERRGGKLFADYVHVDGMEAPVAAIGDGWEKFLFADRIGSVVAVADGEGSLAARCDYSPAGRPISVMLSGRPGAAADEEFADCAENSIPFGFAGHPYDYGHELSYMRHRFYSAKLERFISPDPLGYKVPLDADASASIAPALSYHRGQGAASRATIPNRSLSMASAGYDAYPFGRIFARSRAPFEGGETNLYQYGSSDPTTFVDPMGLSSLVFDRSDNRMTLYDGKGRDITKFDASNIAVDGHAPFASGTYQVGVPEFYSYDYRDALYKRFGFGIPGGDDESKVTGPLYEITAGGKRVRIQGWDGDDVGGNYNISQGRIRFRAGASGMDAANLNAWNREIFIHGGRSGNYKYPTHGCIRGEDLQLEILAADFIELRRENDPVGTLTVRE
ncbi:MAG: DUF6531 domain-containing protein [Pseudomonadota bacterium]